MQVSLLDVVISSKALKQAILPVPVPLSCTYHSIFSEKLKGFSDDKYYHTHLLETRGNAITQSSSF